MDRSIVISACRSVYALFAHCPDLCHVAAYGGHGSPYIVAYSDGPCGPPWLPVMDLDGVPVYCQTTGSISVLRAEPAGY